MPGRTTGQFRPNAAGEEPERFLPFVSLMQTALSGLAPRTVWRDVTALLAGLVVYGSVDGALIFHWRQFQIPLLVGIVVGLVASGILRAGGIALGSVAVGFVLLPGIPYESTSAATPPWEVFVLVVLAAAGVRWAAGRNRVAASALLAVGVFIVVANLWVSTVSFNSVSLAKSPDGAPMPPLFAQLQGEGPQIRDDMLLYRRVYERMAEGQGFYTAFRDSFIADFNGTAPSEFYHFRTPYLFWLWQLQPFGPAGIVYALLVLATGALLSVVVMQSVIVRLPLSLPAIAALAAFFMRFTVMRDVLFAEPWAASFGVMSLGCYVRSAVSVRRRVWLAAAVVLAVCAGFMRELSAPLLLAGLLTAVVVERDRFSIVAWASGIGVFALTYVAHIAITAPLSSHAPSVITRQGAGLGNVANALGYASRFFGAPMWFPVALAIVGMAAIAFLPTRRNRLFVAVCVAILLAGPLLVSDTARDAASAQAVNYWGALSVPLLYACLPAVFVGIPGMAAPRPGQGRPMGA